MTLKVSVVIPHYNDLSNLDMCLTLLMRQQLPCEEFEIIVADNNSACGLAAVEALAGNRARVIPAPEQGAAPARNVGVAAATAPVLAFIDSDCRPREGWLSSGLSAVETVDIAGGRVDVLLENPDRPTAVEAFEAVFAFRFDKYIARDKFAVTCNMFVRRNVFDAVGGFRVGVSEDKDWCHRALAQGYQLTYAGDAIVGHPARRTFPDLIKKWRRVTKESYGYAIAHGHSRLSWFMRSFFVLASSVPHTWSLLTSPNVASLADRIKAVPVLYRIRAYRFLEMNRVLIGSVGRAANGGDR